MGSSDFDRDAVWDDATTAVGLCKYQKLASRTGLVEAYAAEWHCYGGCLDPGGIIRVRANRYSHRTTIKAEVFGKWQDTPSEVKRRFLTISEFQQIAEWVENAGFWQLESRHCPSSSGFHAETWTIEGFRDGQFHFVRRNTWSIMENVGVEVFEFGKSMTRLAGVTRFQDEGAA